MYLNKKIWQILVWKIKENFLQKIPILNFEERIVKDTPIIFKTHKQHRPRVDVTVRQDGHANVVM